MNRFIYLAKWKCSVNAFEAPDGSKRSCILRAFRILIVVRFVDISLHELLQCDARVALPGEKVPCQCGINPESECSRISFMSRCTLVRAKSS